MPKFKLEDVEAEVLLHPDKIKVLIPNIDNMINKIFFIFMTSRRLFLKILYIDFFIVVNYIWLLLFLG